MGANFSRLKDWVYEKLYADDLDAEFNNILNNFDPDGMDDASATVGAMQTTNDPYPGSAESLPTSLRGELQRIRYLIKQQHGAAQWYIFPDLVTKTTTYTITVNDRVVLCNATSGAFTVTLPTAVGNTDKMFFIKKTDSSANAVTIDGSGAETIDGAATATLAVQYDFRVIVSNGTGWFILASSGTSTTPTITDFTNATHTHANSAGGGNLGAFTGTSMTVSGAAPSPPTANTLYSDLVPKAWGSVTYSAGTPTLGADVNISGIVDDATGKITITWDRDFADVNYAAFCLAQRNTDAQSLNIGMRGGASDLRAVGSCGFSIDNAGTFTDPVVFTVLAFGTQV